MGILASGAALGVYVPAVLLERQLHDRGVPSEVVVLESLFTDESREKLERHRRAYHESFELARMAHRIPPRALGLDPKAVETLLASWQAEGRSHFVVWSGFWLAILEEYSERVDGRVLDVELCRIDAVASTSFRGGADRLQTAREVWFWSAADGALVHELPVDGREPVPFSRRRRRLAVHGGGWGIGTYRSRARELDGSGIGLDVVVHQPGESRLESPLHAEYRVDPDWAPWLRDARGRHGFPPLGRVGDAGAFETVEAHHPFFDLIGDRLAIVSKPGGGTLLDSLAAATPVVLLEPYGPAEQQNAALWERLGFGISFAGWRETGFDLAVLEALHDNLLRRDAPTVSYPAAYAQRYRHAMGGDGGES